MDTENKVGQRGPDKQPREFNPKSLFNLKQFQKPISAVNPNVTAYWAQIGILLILIVGGFVVWRIWNKKLMINEA